MCEILRIDPAAGPQTQAYTIPADNPRRGSPDALGEVWASGLRDPQRFSWDADTGRMTIADIGSAMPEFSGSTVLSDPVSGRLFYFDPLSAGGAATATANSICSVKASGIFTGCSR